MAVLVYAVGRPELAPFPMPDRFRHEITYFMTISGQGDVPKLPAGEYWVRLVDAKNALEQLPQPVIAVMVDNSANRLGDLANHRAFADFMANELIPAIRAKYPVTRDPAHTTLAGYSAIWLARALPPGGRLITLEFDPRHADVARANLARAGVTDRVDVRVGRAIDALPGLAGGEPFDLIFIDADKPGYSTYLDLSVQLSRPGTVILGDNLIRDGAVLDETVTEENARAARAFNAKLAADQRLESIIIPVNGKRVDGMSISIVR